MSSRDLMAGGALLLVVVALAAPALVSGRVYVPRHTDAIDVPWSQSPDRLAGAEDEPLNFASSDKFNLIYPDQRYARSEANKGHLPEWNPYVLGGVPHAANPLTAVFYPLNWVLLLVGPESAPLVTAALHVVLAGLFVLLFLRMIGLSPIAAAFGGACFAFSGWVAAHLQNTQLVATVTWWPLGLFAIEARLRGRGRWSLMVLSVAVGMMWVAGWPQVAVLGSLVMAAWTLCGLIGRLRDDGRALVMRHAGGILLFALIGLLLASVQILPTMELMEHAGHQDRTVESAINERFRLGGWLGAVMPEFMGGADEANWKGHLGAVIAVGDGPGAVPNVMSWGERTIYPGILVLALSLVGVLYARDRVRWGLVVLALLGVLMSSSETVIRLLAGIPALNVGAPARSVVLTCFALACLAGCGFQVLLDGRLPRVLSRVRIISLLTVIPLGLLGALVGWAMIDERSFLEGLVGFLKTTGIADRLAPPGQLPPDEKCIELLAGSVAGLKADLMRLLLVGGLGCVFFIARVRKPAWSSRLAAATCCVVLLDLLTFFAPPNQPVSGEGLFRATPGLRFLQENAGTDRIMRVSPSLEAAASEYHTMFVPNLGLLYGLHDAQGWREQVPLWYPEYWKGVAAVTADVGVSGIPVEQAGSLALDLARVRYLLARHPIPALAPYQVFPFEGSEPGGMTIYENRNALPRAWVVHSARCLPEDEACALVRRGAVDPRKEAVLHEWPPEVRSDYKTTDGVDEVTFLREDPGRLELDVTTTGGGFLLINDTWFPNWRAWTTDADGVRKEVPVARAYATFMAIPVAGGYQRVEVSYEPEAITNGFVLTTVGWIGLLLLPLAGGRRRSASDHPGRASRDEDASLGGAES